MTEDVRQMNQLINDARELIGEMKAQHSIYKSLFDQQSKIMDQKMGMLQSSWKGFRNITMFLFTLIIVPITTGGIVMKGQVNEIQKVINKEDHLEIQDFVNSVNVVLEYNTDLFEEIGAAPERIAKHNSRVREGITRVIDVSRSPIKK